MQYSVNKKLYESNLEPIFKSFPLKKLLISSVNFFLILFSNWLDYLTYNFNDSEMSESQSSFLLYIN